MNRLFLTIFISLSLCAQSFAMGNIIDRGANSAEVTAQERDDIWLSPASIPYIVSGGGLAYLSYNATSDVLDVNATQMTVGRDSDGTVGLLLERRYVGKFDWLIQNNGHLEIYGDDGNGTNPTTLRFRLNDDGSIDCGSIRSSGLISADSSFYTPNGYVFEGGQTGDTWYWIGQTSDDGADDDDLLYIGKGGTVGTTSFMSVDGSGNLSSNGTITSAGAIAGTTFNSGQGANELYDMNQNVQTTDNVTFNNVELSGGVETNSTSRIMGISTTTYTDANATLTTADLGKLIVMYSASDTIADLPSMGADEDGGQLWIAKVGAGKVTIDAADSDTIGRSGAGDTIYNDEAAEIDAVVHLKYVHAVTRWLPIGNGTWVPTD